MNRHFHGWKCHQFSTFPPWHCDHFPVTDPCQELSASLRHHPHDWGELDQVCRGTSVSGKSHDPQLPCGLHFNQAHCWSGVMTMNVQTVALLQWPLVEQTLVCCVSIPSSLCPCAHDGPETAHRPRYAGALIAKAFSWGGGRHSQLCCLWEKKKICCQKKKWNCKSCGLPRVPARQTSLPAALPQHGLSFPTAHGPLPYTHLWSFCRDNINICSHAEPMLGFAAEATATDSSPGERTMFSSRSVPGGAALIGRLAFFKNFFSDCLFLSFIKLKCCRLRGNDPSVILWPPK